MRVLAVILIFISDVSLVFSSVPGDTTLLARRAESDQIGFLNSTVIEGEVVADSSVYIGRPTGLESYSFYSIRFQRNLVPISDRSGNSFLELHVLSGIRKGKKIVIADINRDNDFSNDEQYEYSIIKATRKQALDKVSFVKVPYEFIHKNIRHRRLVDLKILPFEPIRYSAVSTQELLKVYFLVDVSKSSRFEVGGRPFEIELLDPDDVDAGYSHCSLRVRDVQSDSVFSYEPVLKVGDAFLLADQSVTVDKVSFFGDTISLKTWRADKLAGIRDQNNLPQDIVDVLKRKVDSGPFVNNGYLLIDFWGSWCGPCIAAIPELKELARSFGPSGRLQVLSVAFERQTDTTHLQKLIQKYELNWQHIFEFDTDKTSSGSLVSLFKISGFPTTLLLDSDYKIIYRGLGLESMSNLKRILQIRVK
jgi:thiol-disulfide isomerase/thioredoxin